MTYSFSHQHSLSAMRRVTSRLRMAIGTMAILAMGLSGLAAHAQTYSEHTLHNFQGPTTDGNFCQSRLLDADINGTEMLYGTTSRGGTEGHGTIFSLNPITHAETVLYNFTDGATDGEEPLAGLILVGGTLIGVTEIGSSNYGTIFSINPDGTHYQTLYAFSGSDGANPAGDLVADGSTLYGTTVKGGTNGFAGTVFAFNLANHTLKTLHAFADDADGGYPIAGLLQSGGVLYGTTQGGALGSGPGNGTLFMLNDDGTGFKTLHQFTGYSSSGSSEAQDSQATLIDVNGTIYGTSLSGGSYNYGCIFSFNPSTHAVQTLHSFGASSTDGARSWANLINVGGVLFGTTSGGGNTGTGDTGNGTVFSINPDGTNYQIRYNFSPTQTGEINSDGGDPRSALIAVGGTLIGTTYGLGADSSGTVFALTPSSATTPVAHNDACTVKYNTARINAAPGVLANDNNGGINPISAALVTGTTHGSITLGSDGSFTYTPNTGYVGTDTFTYRVSNPIGQGTIGTVTLTVQASVPMARNDACTIKYNTARTNAAPGVLANDDNGGSSPMTASLVTNVAHGTLTLGSDGSFTYTPNTGYSGTDTFTYRASNSVGQSNIATVTLNVQ